jgi:cell division protein FtsL
VIRPATAFWTTAVILVGYAMFQVKYEVAQQEDELAKVTRQIGASREAIRVLNAEWSFLTQPARLSALAKRHLNLAPIATAQLGSVADLPMRNSAGGTELAHVDQSVTP